jgi:transposase InsO family protein
MRRHGIRALAGRRFRPCTTDSRHYLPIAPNLLARPAPGLICHSDRGSQYAAGTYIDHLAVIGAVPSMSRTGNCYDNAPMESFFHTLQVELVHQCRCATQAEARQALFGYIKGYYNRHRMHSALGYLTPEQAEQRMTG